MNDLLFGLLMVFSFYALFLLACVALVKPLPASFLGAQARSILSWLPPFVGGEALRNWAATNAEQLTQNRLAGQ